MPHKVVPIALRKRAVDELPELAIATDLEDDTYDLSWYRQLAEDHMVATRQLRSLLERENELISRHYLFRELEHRLYRCRASLPSALDEFDAACTQHHAEMGLIRTALLERFGAVPVIEMYRQAVIRAQKAKLWEAAQEWAEKGIAVYGDSPAQKLLKTSENGSPMGRRRWRPRDGRGRNDPVA